MSDFLSLIFYDILKPYSEFLLSEGSCSRYRKDLGWFHKFVSEPLKYHEDRECIYQNFLSSEGAGEVSLIKGVFWWVIGDDYEFIEGVIGKSYDDVPEGIKQALRRVPVEYNFMKEKSKRFLLGFDEAFCDERVFAEFILEVPPDDLLNFMVNCGLRSGWLDALLDIGSIEGEISELFKTLMATLESRTVSSNRLLFDFCYTKYLCGRDLSSSEWEFVEWKVKDVMYPCDGSGEVLLMAYIQFILVRLAKMP